MGETSRKVLITGASRGIGKATAKAFLATGEQLALSCRCARPQREAIHFSSPTMSVAIDERAKIITERSIYNALSLAAFAETSAASAARSAAKAARSAAFSVSSCDSSVRAYAIAVSATPGSEPLRVSISDSYCFVHARS